MIWKDVTTKPHLECDSRGDEEHGVSHSWLLCLCISLLPFLLASPLILLGSSLFASAFTPFIACKRNTNTENALIDVDKSYFCSSCPEPVSSVAFEQMLSKKCDDISWRDKCLVYVARRMCDDISRLTSLQSFSVWVCSWEGQCCVQEV